jgi:uncharacterized protein
MRVVVDTNCLLASISPKASGHGLYKAFIAEQFDWVLSNEIVSEYTELLSERYSPRTAELVLDILLVAPNTVFQEALPGMYMVATNDRYVDLAKIHYKHF